MLRRLPFNGRRIAIHAGTIGGAVLLMAATSSAQAVTTPQSTFSNPLWDASGGVGLHYVNVRDVDDEWSSWDAKFQPRFQIGRYFTPHLKTELAVSAPTSWTSYDTETFPVPGLVNG